jgi:hypothetical protein
MNNIRNNYCVHGYSFSYCPNACLRYIDFKEKVIEDRRDFLKRFSKKDWKNPITKLTIIKGLQELYLMEHYPLGIPTNLITKII